jgi:hypothetical protein
MKISRNVFGAIMGAVQEELNDSLPLAIDIAGSGEQLAQSLLAGRLVRYTDPRFQVSSGECHFILKLVQEQEHLVLFYAQVPYVYPLPDDLKTGIKTSLEKVLNMTVLIEFINAGAQAQKKDVEHSASLLGD